LFDSIEINNSIVQLNARQGIAISGGGPSAAIGRNGIKRKQVLQSNGKNEGGEVTKSMNMNPFKT
jgi:hypothetical protein